MILSCLHLKFYCPPSWSTHFVLRFSRMSLRCRVWVSFLSFDTGLFYNFSFFFVSLDTRLVDFGVSVVVRQFLRSSCPLPWTSFDYWLNMSVCVCENGSRGRHWTTRGSPSLSSVCYTSKSMEESDLVFYLDRSKTRERRCRRRKEGGTKILEGQTSVEDRYP